MAVQHVNLSLGDLISRFFEQFLAQYGDEELAAIATAVMIDDILFMASDADHCELN